MAWDERQQRLLAAMGLRVWSPPAAGAPAAEIPAVAAVAAVAEAEAGPPVRACPAQAVPAAAPAQAPAAAPRSPATGALAGLGWPELREAVAGCRACSLCEKRTQTVFGVGHPQAAWMVVGEAPGEQEDREGEPFVGAAGQLLDRMLAALSLTRAADGEAPREQRVYIANTLKCRPPGNRNPTPEELAKCEPFLVRQIELVRPRLILAMGRFAVQALLRSDEPIGKLRGRVHRYQGVPLVVTYHPAYLLRNLPEKAKAWDDLCLAAEVFEGRAGGTALDPLQPAQ
jgi:DNA polymerase